MPGLCPARSSCRRKWPGACRNFPSLDAVHSAARADSPARGLSRSVKKQLPSLNEVCGVPPSNRPKSSALPAELLACAAPLELLCLLAAAGAPPGPSGYASPLAATPPTHLPLGLPRLCRSKLAHPSRIHLEQILRRRRRRRRPRHGGLHRWKRTNASRDFIKGRRGFFREDGANLWRH